MSNRNEKTYPFNKAADPRRDDNRDEKNHKPDDKQSHGSTMVKFDKSDLPKLLVWPGGSMAINFQAANKLSVKAGGYVALYHGGGIRIGIKPSDKNDPAAYMLKEFSTERIQDGSPEKVLEIECPEFLELFGGAEQIMNLIGYPLKWDSDLGMLTAVIE